MYEEKIVHLTLEEKAQLLRNLAPYIAMKCADAFAQHNWTRVDYEFTTTSFDEKFAKVEEIRQETIKSLTKVIRDSVKVVSRAEAFEMMRSPKNDPGDWYYTFYNMDVETGRCYPKEEGIHANWAHDPVSFGEEVITFILPGENTDCNEDGILDGSWSGEDSRHFLNENESLIFGHDREWWSHDRTYHKEVKFPEPGQEHEYMFQIDKLIDPLDLWIVGP